MAAKRKTQLCRHWLKGECSNTDCNYAHGKEELAHPSMINNHLKNANNRNRNGGMNNQNNSAAQTAQRSGLLFKTSLCHKFVETGNCPYGPRCRFAHGKEDLKKKPNFEDPNTQYILELEKENSKLKQRIRELEGVLGGHGIMVPRIQMQRPNGPQQQNFGGPPQVSRQNQKVYSQLGQLNAQIGGGNLMQQIQQQQQAQHVMSVPNPMQFQQQQQQHQAAAQANTLASFAGALNGGVENTQAALVQAQLLQLLLQRGLGGVNVGGREEEEEDEESEVEENIKTEHHRRQVDPQDPLYPSSSRSRRRHNNKSRSQERERHSRKSRHSNTSSRSRERDYY